MFARIGLACVLAVAGLSLTGCEQPNPAGQINQLLNQKKYQKAIDLLTSYLEKNPTDVESYQSRGVAYCRAERLEEGLADFDKVISLNPDHDQALKERAKCLRDLRRWPEAIEALDRVLEKNPYDSDYYLHRARCHEALEHFDLTIADLDKSLEIDPGNGFSHFLLAHLLSTCPNDKLRNSERATEEAKIVMGMTSPTSEVHGLALCIVASGHAERGEYEKAIELQEKGLALLPSKRDQEEAQKVLEEYRKAKPDPPESEAAEDLSDERIEPAKPSE